MRLTHKGRTIGCNRFVAGPDFFAHGAVPGGVPGRLFLQPEELGLGQAEEPGEEPGTVDRLTSFLQKYGDIIKLGTTLFLAVRFFGRRK